MNEKPKIMMTIPLAGLLYAWLFMQFWHSDLKAIVWTLMKILAGKDGAI